MKYDSPLDCRIAGTLLGWTLLIDSCCLQTVQYDAIKHIARFIIEVLGLCCSLNIYGCEIFYDLCASVRVRSHGGKWYKNFTMLCLMTSPPHNVGTLVRRYTTLRYTPLHQAHFGLGRTVLVWLCFTVLKTDLCSAWWVSRLARWSPVCVEDVTGSGNAAQLRRVLS